MENKEKKNRLDFDFAKYIKSCFVNWWIFAIAVVACLFLACAYILIRKPMVEINAQLMLPPENTAGSNLLFGDLASTFNMTDMFGGSSTENEIAVMQSYSVFLRTAQDLGLNTSYFQKTGVARWMPAYDGRQLQLTTLPSINDTISVKLRFDLQLLDNGNFDIKVKYKRTTLLDEKNQTLPVTLDTPYGPFTIEKTANFGMAPCEKFRILFNSYSGAAQGYAKLVNIYAPNKKTDFIAMSYLSTDPKFGEKFLNTLIDNYNLIGNLQRYDRDNNTMQFLTQRIDEISAQLANSENSIIEFKKANNITNVDYDAATVLTKTTEFDNRLFMMQTELEIIEVTRDFLNNPANNYSLIPMLTGAEQLIENYNEIILQRIQLLNTAKSDNKAIKLMDQQIDAMRENIIKSVDKIYENQKLKMADLRKEYGKMKNIVSKIPTLENEYIGLERNSRLQLQLYMFLMKQREETAMSLSKVTPTLITVDPPYTLSETPGLSTPMVILLAIFFGGVIGLVWIFYKKYPRMPLSELKTLKDCSTAPVIGEIKREKDSDFLAVTNPSGGESIRMLRADIEFILQGIEGNRMLISSFDRPEESAYVAANLAASFALQGSKTLLIDANLHEPTLSAMLGVNDSHEGIAAVSSMNAKERGPLPTVNINGNPLWVLPAGNCKGAPADAVASAEFANLVEGYKSAFAYIIINCPQLKDCCDTYSVARLVDLSIIDINLQKDEPRDIEFVNQLTANGRLPRIAIVATTEK